MIRKLMASSALVALIGAGAVTTTMAADTTKPAVTDNAANAGNATEMTAKEKKLVPDTPTLATAFIGRSVYSSNEPDSDSIGDVNDLIIGDDGAITDAVVGVGGFLGIGEKNVAVPFDKLQVVESDGKIRLIYAATRDQLEAAPAVDLSAYDPAARYSKQQTAAADNAAADNAAPLAPAPTGDLTAAPADQNLASSDKNKAADQTTAMDSNGGFLTASSDQIRATTVIGKEVYNSEDESIGEVSDLVLQKEGGTRAALVDVGGFLGVGAKTVAIPFDELKFSRMDEVAEPKVTVAMSKEQVEQLPEYMPAPSGNMSAEQPMNNATPTDTMAAGEQPKAEGTPDDKMAAEEPNAAAPDANQAPADQMADQTEQKPIVTGAIGASPTAQDVPASKLIGTTVYGNDDANIGEVSDVIFDPSGQIDAVVVDVGGFLGMGEKPVAVDFDALNVRTDQNGKLTVTVSATQDELEKAPTYKVSMK